MKIYLTGPLTLGVTGREEMAKALYLMHGDLKKFSPLDFIPDDPNSTTAKEFMNLRITALLGCDKVVTMDHIEMDPFAQLEVTIARTMQIEVVPFWKFMQNGK